MSGAWTACLGKYLRAVLLGLTCLRAPAWLAALLAAAWCSAPGSDPVAELDARLAAGEAELHFDEQWGYLPAVLPWNTRFAMEHSVCHGTLGLGGRNSPLAWRASLATAV